MGSRALMEALGSAGAYILPEATVVEVVGRFPSGNPQLSDIAKIAWDHGTHTGYFYFFELTSDRRVRSR
jgi:hypothetical protein